MNSGGGGRPGRGPSCVEERRRDYRRADYDGHELDGTDPDMEIHNS
jgi:hypothetical protein